MPHPTILAVPRSPTHSFSKQPALSIRLIAGIGVEGDAHAGATVKHRSRVARDPTQPNLRQVHLIHAELLDELNAKGFSVKPGDLGENITTRGLDLLALPAGTRLMIGEAVIEVTGLRNPCAQLDKFQQGLMQAVLGRDAEGNLIRKAGEMGVVMLDGDMLPGHPIEAQALVEKHPLQPVWKRPIALFFA
ncbi:MAG: MOSC domain-containing protein [Dongiaceae bacterium]